MEKEIILVDAQDNVVGYSEKLQAHIDGALHRAFSVFVVNGKGQMMLHKRASHKYHSPGLWTNTCCSHPLRGERQEKTVHDRLRFEMGFDCPVQPLFKFLYKAPFENGLTEHELDHVYLGHYEGSPKPNPEEVEDWKWMDIDEIKRDMQRNPHLYTYWFKYCFRQFGDAYNEYMASTFAAMNLATAI